MEGMRRGRREGAAGGGVAALFFVKEQQEEPATQEQPTIGTKSKVEHSTSGTVST